MKTFDLYKKALKFPFGKQIFTFLFCKRVPYFSTIYPKINVYDEGIAEVEMSQRRSVQNHIQTIHAIAVCNLCELAMGLVCESTIPDNLRWIPAGMNVQYLKKATGTLKAVAKANKSDFKPGRLDIHIDVFNAKNETITTADITVYIKEK